jgi:hypothetical protein
LIQRLKSRNIKIQRNKFEFRFKIWIQRKRIFFDILLDIGIELDSGKELCIQCNHSKILGECIILINFRNLKLECYKLPVENWPFSYASFGGDYLVTHRLIRNHGTRIGCRVSTVAFLHLHSSKWYLFKT